MIEEDELLEYAVVYNDYKGVPKQQIRDALKSGRDVIMRLDVQGAATIRKLVPGATLVFLTAESEQAMIRRLRERKSETSEGLNLRIATARQEMKRMGEFDYCVVNAEGRQEESVRQILHIIDAEHHPPGQRANQSVAARCIFESSLERSGLAAALFVRRLKFSCSRPTRLSGQSQPS